MLFIIKLVVCFLLWTLYSYLIHVFAHLNFRFNFIRRIHMEHHRNNYGDSKWPPFHDYFFWFGSLNSSLDVWITFTLPLILLTFIDFEVGAALLVFHYFYEVFLSRNVLDHNPNITGKVTNYIPIGIYHLKHHRNYRCNYSFYITLWDHVFRTTAKNS